ncbi:MAG: tetratricopeptide repeat protein [Candidatus Riflebacteria bacterium]|nr:tetratricopeptide repeat protein [Candidatus Riflebacteria bacterium]
MYKKNKKEDYSWVEDFRREHLKKSARNPGLAAIMSFILMGSGQIYAGHIDRGVILLFIHIFSFIFGYSLYSGGFVYEWLISLIGAHFIIVICYILSVIFILTWIYNIKDAYYLSIFSSFRDWFEVERVLLPSMGVPANMLLSSNTNNSMDLLEDKTKGEEKTEVAKTEKVVEAKEEVSDANVKIEDSDVIDVTSEKSTDSQDVEDDNTLYDSAAELVYMNSNSWKVYASLVFVIVLIGIGMGYYYKEDYGDSSFQVSKNFDMSSYNKRIVNSQIKQEEVKTAAQPSPASPVNTVDNPINNMPVNTAQNQQNFNQQNNSINQQQIEAYVDQRIRTLLALSNKPSWKPFYSSFNSDNNNSSENIPLIVSGDVSNSNTMSALNRDNYKREDASNQVVVIQGHKEAKILNKNSNESSEGTGRGVVLYEAPDNGDEVELIMTEENDLHSEPMISYVPANEIETSHVVPNVSQNTIDKLNEEIKNNKEKEKVEDRKVKEEESKGKVLFERSDDFEPKAKETEPIEDKPIEVKPLVLEPSISKKKEKHHHELNNNIESPELRAKLEKIKEKGAQEFYNGNWEAALPFYFEVLKHRRNADSFEMVGIIFEKMNKLTDAFEAYENAYKLGLDSNHNIARLGLIAEKIGEYDKAQKYLEKAIENNPKRADIILSYARCLNKQGESMAAAQVLAVLRDSTNSYAIKKAAEQEYRRIIDKASSDTEGKPLNDKANSEVINE